MRALFHCFATHSPCRHTGTGSVGSACGQSCRGHSTALQVSPKAAWSSSICAREATRFSHAGEQHRDGVVTGAWGRVVVAQSMSAVHSVLERSGGDAVGAASWAGAGLDGAAGAGPLVPRSPHAMTSRRTIECRWSEPVTRPSMPAGGGCAGTI
jgi:hypothetical protein